MIRKMFCFKEEKEVESKAKEVPQSNNAAYQRHQEEEATFGFHIIILEHFSFRSYNFIQMLPLTGETDGIPNSISKTHENLTMYVNFDTKDPVSHSQQTYKSFRSYKHCAVSSKQTYTMYSLN